MKIGFSLSNCIIDIVNGKVDVNDVMLIVTSTYFNIDRTDSANNLVKYHTAGLGAWTFMSNEQRELATTTINILLANGKIYQPREHNAPPWRMPFHWANVVRTDVDMAQNPALKKAWDTYKLLGDLS